MKISFSKYHGAGNDFIMIDGRTLTRPLQADEMTFLCHRYFGVGADGIILIEPDDEDDFTMYYYNADGSSGMMCSNGSRCAIHFARKIGYRFEEANFSCCDAKYQGKIYASELVGTAFPDLKEGRKLDYGYFVDNGAWHLALFDQKAGSFDPREVGRYWRYHEDFAPIGINVNFIEIIDDQALEIVTYERGVEDLTLACGTGALASAMAFVQREGRFGACDISVESDGGTLRCIFQRDDDGFSNIEVIGPVADVFSAEIEVQKLSFS